MTRILMIADIHAKLNNLDVTKECLLQTREIARQADYTLFMGDQYHHKANIRSECQTLFLDILQDWPHRVGLIAGNHDYENFECQGHALTPFFRLENVDVFSSPLLLTPEIGVIPFCRDEKVFLEALDELKGARIICAHQGIDGFSYSNSTPSKSTVTLENLRGFHRVFLGHIHKPQEKDNVMYIGSPFTQDFAEANEKKRVIIYDMHNDTIKEFALDLPQHYVIYAVVGSKADANKIEIPGPDKAHVKLILRGTKDVLDKINKHSLHREDINLQKEYLNDNKQIKIKENLDRNKMIETYIDNLVTDLDKVALNNISQIVLKKVSDAN